MRHLNWVEISKNAIIQNISILKSINQGTLLAACIKGNAYGHDLSLVAQVLDSHVDWWAINAIYEAEKIRAIGSKKPILILGYVSPENLARAIELDCRLVVYNQEVITQLGQIGKPVKVHIKLETGLNRQGLSLESAMNLIKEIQKFPNIEIEGAYSHFANIEDTTDHNYATKQVNAFTKITEELTAPHGAYGMNSSTFPLHHISNSAASLIFPQFKFNLIRPGIAIYGLWPSQETKLSFRQAGHDERLTPALTWKTQIVQVKQVAAGEYVGYGCTYRTTHESTLAILPIGYYDGYPRTAKGAYVVINGKRATICGRICMNIMVAEITGIQGAKVGTEVTLIGKSGDEHVTAEDLAGWVGTINYEVVTRISETTPRILV